MKESRCLQVNSGFTFIIITFQFLVLVVSRAAESHHTESQGASRLPDFLPQQLPGPVHKIVLSLRLSFGSLKRLAEIVCCIGIH